MNKLNIEELISTIAALEWLLESNKVPNEAIYTHTNAIVKLRKQLKHLEDKQNDK